MHPVHKAIYLGIVTAFALTPIVGDANGGGPQRFEGTVKCEGVDQYGGKYKFGPQDIWFDAFFPPFALGVYNRWGQDRHQNYPAMGYGLSFPTSGTIGISFFDGPEGCRFGVFSCTYFETGQLKLTTTTDKKTGVATSKIDGDSIMYQRSAELDEHGRPIGPGTVVSADCEWKLTSTP